MFVKGDPAIAIASENDGFALAIGHGVASH